MFNVPLMLVSLLAMKPLVKLLFSYRETGALCAMKEVELLPDDPKSTECIKQLQQVILWNLLLLVHYITTYIVIKHIKLLS